MRFLKGFGQFWYDFLIGDDWKIAVAVVSVLLVGMLVVLTGTYHESVLTISLAVGIAVSFTIALLIDVRNSAK